MNKGIYYDCRWSNELDGNFIKNYIHLQDSVFHNAYKKKLFEKKFLKNIYGPSVIVVAYKGDKPVGARTLWRNDIAGRVAYQPGDVCVLEEFRGLGIFTQMTQKAFAMLERDSLIYTFPNANSFPAHLKMGNKLLSSYYPRLFSYKRYKKEHTLELDKAYFNWWLSSSDKIKYIKRHGVFYLVLPYGLPLMYMVLGEVEESVALNFKRSSFGVYFYRSTVKTFYNKRKRPIHIVCKDDDDVKYIPTWKVDSLGY